MRAVASTTTAEASAFGPELREEHLASAEGWRVVTTGTIRAFAGDWGITRLTHQGSKYLRPVLPFRAPPVTHATSGDLFWGAKLIFRKLTLRLEAQLDAAGEYASMNTNFVMPGSVDPFSLTALIHSGVANWIYEGYFGALRMSGGYMQVQAPQLRVLPIPPMGGAKDPEVWSRLEDQYRDIARIPSDGITTARASELLGSLWSSLGEGGRASESCAKSTGGRSSSGPWDSEQARQRTRIRSASPGGDPFQSRRLPRGAARYGRSCVRALGS